MSPGAFFALSIGVLVLIVVSALLTLKSGRPSGAALVCLMLAIAGVSLMFSAH